MPQADAPDLGLTADHAYWVSDLKARNASGDPQTAPARAEIDARSAAFGEGQPVTRSFRNVSPQTAAPTPTTIEGTRWARVPHVRPRNVLRLTLANIATATVDGVDAQLSAAKTLRIRVTSDGAGRVRVALPLPTDATLRIAGGPAPGWGGTVDTGGVTLVVANGTKTFVLSPRGG
jgi:hypothetical protein